MDIYSHLFHPVPTHDAVRKPVDIMRTHPWRMANIELVDGGTLAFYDYNKNNEVKIRVAPILQLIRAAGENLCLIESPKLNRLPLTFTSTNYRNVSPICW